MNILFFLTPKAKVAYIEEDYTIRQVLEKMEYHHYQTIPLLSKDGKIIGVISEGDILWFLKSRNLKGIDIEKERVLSVPRQKIYKSITIQTEMKSLKDAIENQSFVPVVDDKNRFIGIITRKRILEYLFSN